MSILKFQRSSAIAVTTVVVLAIVSSSFTLWLVDSWIKYPLFLYEIFIIAVIYVLLRNNHDGFDNGNRHRRHRYDAVAATSVTIRIIYSSLKTKRIFRGFILDVFLIIFSAILILLNGFHMHVLGHDDGTGISFQLALAFLCSSFLSGYALFNIFKLSRYFSKLESLPLSFFLSFIFSGFSTLMLLPVEEHTRTIIMPILYVSLGVFSLAIRYKNKSNETSVDRKGYPSFSRNIDILAIVSSILFYIIFFYCIYPNFALLPGTDISRHYNYSVILSRTPELYTQFGYILFHAFYVSVYNLSGLSQSIASFQSIFVTLNLFLPILIYTLSKRFLEAYDKRIPALSTIFYSILSNFSFIYFTQVKLTNIDGSSEIQMLGGDAAEKAFNGTINFLQPFAWFVPLSVSFMFFIIAFILLKSHDIPRSKFVPIFSVLILAMYLAHVTEAVIFVIFIAVYSLFSRSNSLRLDDALLSSLIGFNLIGAFLIYEFFFWTSDLSRANIDFKVVLAVLVPMLLLGISIFWRSKVLFKIKFKSRLGASRRFYSVISMFLTAVYVFGFFAWFFAEDFRTSSIYDIGAVPWFIYPLMLGIVGLLAILSMRHLDNVQPSSSISIIFASILLMFLLGRIVSFLNFNLSYVASGYWEKRFLPYIFVFVSILAPLALIKFRERIIDDAIDIKIHKERKTQIFRIASVTAIICIIVVSGFSSMAIKSEYWFVSANASKISGKEIQAINYLKSALQKDRYAYIISPSDYSQRVLAFSAPPYELSLPQILVSSKYPDLPLLGLAAHNLEHAYIYIHNRDFKIVENQQQSWFTRHLISMLPVVFSNSEVTIYNSPHVSFPSSNSDTKMIVPSDALQASENSWAYAYDIISQSGKNYTVMYDQDPNVLKAKTAILSFDPKVNPSFYENFSNIGNNNWNVISGNWNYSSNGLHAGTHGEARNNNIENTILSSISSRGLLTNASFRITNVDPNAASYISIVYSWVDAKNYKYAGIMTYNNAVYVHFATVTNGKSSFSPTWPGIKTNLKWKPGDLFNISLRDSSNESPVEGEELTLNGTIYLNHYATTRGQVPSYSNLGSGYVGLSYDRVKEVVFDHFSIQRPVDKNNNAISSLSGHNLSDYIQYVKSGGNLVVFDTNGYGSIANFLFNASNSSSYRTVKNIMPNDIITSTGHYYSDKKSNQTSFITSQASEQPSSLYLSSKGKSLLFAVESQIGLGKISYMNVYPLISQSYGDNNTTHSKEVYRTLGRLSTLLELKPLTSQPTNFKSLPASFESLTESHGHVTLNTSSILVPTNKIDQIKVMTLDQKEYSINNITDLIISGYNYASLQAAPDTNFTLSNGRGLYTDVTFKSAHSPLKLSFVNNSGYSQATIRGQSDTKSFQFNDISSISVISQKPIQITVRQPSIRIDHTSETVFKNMNYNQLNVLGSDVKINGDVYLSMFMSDTRTFVNRINLHGIVQTLSSSPIFNEMKYFVPSISIEKLYSIPSFPRALSLIPIVVAGIFIFFVRPKIRQ